MKRFVTARFGLALMVAGLTACEADDTPEADLDTGAEAVAIAPAPPPIPLTEGSAVEGGAALTVAQTPEYGPYLADAAGRALYLLENEPRGNSNCYDACAAEWPPYIAPQGTPTAGAAEVQAGMIGTLQRRDGSMQVTYNGHPLYYYVKDAGAGKATGQDVTDQWGEWYLVTPAGEELEAHEGGGGS